VGMLIPTQILRCFAVCCRVSADAYIEVYVQIYVCTPMKRSRIKIKTHRSILDALP